MEKYDWTSNIKMCIFLLRVVGLWPKGDATYNFSAYTFHAIIFLSVFYIGHIFFQAVNIYFIRKNLAAVTGTVYILFVEILGVLKIYFLIKNMKTFKDLLKILETDMFQPKNSIQISAIEINIWFWKIMYNTFLYISVGANMFWAIYPLVDRTGSGEKRLPFLAWYPFETAESPGYEIAYTYQILSTASIITAHVNLDGLVAALNVFNASQFDILCDKLRNLHKHGENATASLIECVRHHKEILKFADRCNKFLNWILFGQFLVGAFTIGLTMFELTLVVPLSTEFCSLTTFGIAITAQTFMYCWFGNEIEVKSNGILYAAFQCEWTDFSNSTQKDLLFFTVRAQQPVKLSALHLFDFSLSTFLKVLKTSWSYFALLNQVNATK